LQLSRFACLIAQHPAINHAVILQEVRLLRQHFDIYTASVRGPDRPSAQLSEEERDEVKRTFYVNPAGAPAAFAALASTCFSNPIRFAGGLWYAVKLAGSRLKQLPLNLAYFVQAAVVGHWMRRNQLTHLHTHYSSTVALLVHKTFGFEISITLHGSGEFNDPVGFWIREKVSASAWVRAISQYGRSQVMKSSDVADWSKVHVVSLGIEPPRFTPRPFRANPSPVEILCVGSLAPAKAQHILLGALHNLKQAGAEVRLHLAGDGDDRHSLERETARLGLKDRVIFHGWTLHEKLDALYRQADIFVLPSFAEGVPVVLMEAMAMEIPCVSTWITGIPELICNGVDGLLVAPSDVDGLADAILKLIEDPDLRQRIGQAGRARVLDKFDLRRNSLAMAEVFRRYSMKA
jgi:glycosyltransferase involved in cell wall biosynthesis